VYVHIEGGREGDDLAAVAGWRHLGGSDVGEDDQPGPRRAGGRLDACTCLGGCRPTALMEVTVCWADEEAGMLHRR
jgi:hypothetical protein